MDRTCFVHGSVGGVILAEMRALACTIPLLSPTAGLPAGERLSEGLVRSLVVVAVPEAAGGASLASRVDLWGEAMSALRVLWSRSRRPFCSGCPGSMRSGMMPSVIHHADSGERLPMPTPVNGGPLSVRMTRGRPYSLKARSTTRQAL